MRPERSTNLMAGINSGFGQFKKFLDVAGSDNLDKYALSLVITTDGMPSAQWHPARGASGYAPLVKNLRKDLSKLHPAAPPTVTTIGIGFQLVSKRRRERRRGCPHPLLRCTLPFPSSSLHPHPLTPPPSHPTPPSFHPRLTPPHPHSTPVSPHPTLIPPLITPTPFSRNPVPPSSPADLPSPLAPDVHTDVHTRALRSHSRPTFTGLGDPHLDVRGLPSHARPGSNRALHRQPPRRGALDCA
jgi:hypothetical protein